VFLTEATKEHKDCLSIVGLPYLCFLWFEEAPTFQRNLALVSVLYICERPEMTSHDEESTKVTTVKLK
jgi:hypothetical protein